MESSLSPSSSERDNFCSEPNKLRSCYYSSSARELLLLRLIELELEDIRDNIPLSSFESSSSDETTTARFEEKKFLWEELRRLIDIFSNFPKRTVDNYKSPRQEEFEQELDDFRNEFLSSYTHETPTQFDVKNEELKLLIDSFHYFPMRDKYHTVNRKSTRTDYD